MKLNAIALVLFFAACALGVNAQKERGFASKEGNFSITPPIGYDKLEYERRTRSTESGDVVVSQYSASLERGTCLISYYDLPENIFQTKSVDNIFSDSVAEILRSGKTTISNQKNLSVDGYPAISFDLRVANSSMLLHTRAVMVIARPRSYTYLFATNDQAELSRPDVLNFFKSFHIQN